MRLFATLLVSNGRKAQCVNNVPFKAILPLRLRNFVSGKADSVDDVACLHEMSVLFAAMKNNDFNETLCTKEITQLKRSYKTYLERKSAEKRVQNLGILSPGKDLNYKQLNKLLRTFPSS